MLLELTLSDAPDSSVEHARFGGSRMVDTYELTFATQYLVIYPVSQGRLLNVSIVVQHSERTDTIHDEPWSTTVPQAEVKAAFTGWSSYVQNILDVSTSMRTPPQSSNACHLCSA